MRTIQRTKLNRGVHRALQHPRADNRHLRRILRWAVDPADAAALYELLRARSCALVAEIDATEHLDDYSTFGLLLRSDAGDILEEGDLRLLEVGIDDAIDAFVGYRRHDEGHLPENMSADPVAAVRVAYALTRDLTTVEFSNEVISILD
jgi:hypothetical protein